MIKRLFYIFLILVLVFVVGAFIHHKTTVTEDVNADTESFISQEETELQQASEPEEIVEISIDSVEGITPEEAEELCYLVMGEADKETGFTFSFGVAGAIKQGKKQYYVIRASWLVNNSHMSYIGDFFVAADGSEIYSGTVRPDTYTMANLIWSK